MLERITSWIKATVATTLLILNILVAFSIVFPLGVVKLLLPFAWVRKACNSLINPVSNAWVHNNSGWMKLVQPQPWHISGVEGLSPKGWYLIGSNHQSWVDILVLQRAFDGHVPLLKFFIKKELIFVPIMGLAWWALDFPFMRRKGSGSAAKDLEAARKACAIFRLNPTSVISFMEGTRVTPEKHQKQKSPYKHLLKPKTGGIAMALETIGEQFECLLDVTIVYPHGVPTFSDLLAGRVKDVIVNVHRREIPVDLKVVSEADTAYRQRLQHWINDLWAAKDEEIERTLAQFKQGQMGRGKRA
ncbi:MAG: acyltransferase [Acidobacteriota bacterium]